MDSLAVTAGFEIRLTSAQSQLFCFLVVGPGAGLSEPVCFSEHRKGKYDLLCPGAESLEGGHTHDALGSVPAAFRCSMRIGFSSSHSAARFEH